VTLAEKRLEADDPLADDLHDGLILEPELVALECGSEVRLELDAVDDGGVHALFGESAIAASALLCSLRPHRDMCAFGLGAVRDAECHAGGERPAFREEAA
jgi:hypothetical protein